MLRREPEITNDDLAGLLDALPREQVLQHWLSAGNANPTEALAAFMMFAARLMLVRMIEASKPIPPADPGYPPAEALGKGKP